VTRQRRGASLLCASAATLAALAWQALTVEFNFRGDWTAIFHTGERCRVPPALESERVYRFRDSAGYDGQFYHFIAHDPLAVRGFAAYVDNPRMRWRRILVPGLANALALGQDDYVDSLYAAVLLACVFAGAWWLSRWGVAAGLTAWTGMAFLLVPATLISLDRGTVDVALAALAAGFVMERGPRLHAVIAAAPFARETGIFLIAACAIEAALRRRWRDALLAAATAIPFAAWWLRVAAHTSPDLTSHLSPLPFAGIVHRAAHPVVYELASSWIRTAAVLDYAAFVGVCACLVLVWRLRDGGRIWIAAVLFCAALLFVGHPQVWAEAYAFGRIASPLLIFLGVLAVEKRWWWGLGPMAMVLPRILWQLGPQWKGILRGI
jgi:hypothetical protein